MCPQLMASFAVPTATRQPTHQHTLEVTWAHLKSKTLKTWLHRIKPAAHPICLQSFGPIKGPNWPALIGYWDPVIWLRRSAQGKSTLDRRSRRWRVILIPLTIFFLFFFFPGQEKDCWTIHVTFFFSLNVCYCSFVSLGRWNHDNKRVHWSIFIVSCINI